MGTRCPPFTHSLCIKYHGLGPRRRERSDRLRRGESARNERACCGGRRLGVVERCIEVREPAVHSGNPSTHPWVSSRPSGRLERGGDHLLQRRTCDAQLAEGCLDAAEEGGDGTRGRREFCGATDGDRRVDEIASAVVEFVVGLAAEMRPSFRSKHGPSLSPAERHDHWGEGVDDARGQPAAVCIPVYRRTTRSGGAGRRVGVSPVRARSPRDTYVAARHSLASPQRSRATRSARPASWNAARIRACCSCDGTAPSAAPGHAAPARSKRTQMGSRGSSDGISV